MEIIVNPARAGMILLRRILAARRRGKPRASGDDPVGWQQEEASRA